jgi:8-amino-7-oxononanoate synthase
MGTLGKALGTFGAYICGCELLINHLVNTCRGFIFSTALPAHVAAAALKALEISKVEPWRRAAALHNSALLRQAIGLEASASAIVPIVTGDNKSAIAAAAHLQKQGFDIRAVRPPTVPEGSARLRITANALQKKDDISRLANLLKEIVDGTHR